MQVVVIGGNAAGMTAASRAKRLNPDLDILILERSRFISYSICGLPYYLAGSVDRHERLLTFTPETLNRERGISARVQVEALEILPGRRRVLCRDLQTESRFEVPYETVVMATGYLPKVPAIEGCRLEGVWTVSRLEDGIRIGSQIQTGACRRVAIVGGGYIGLMMAHALRTRGLEVLLLERRAHLYPQMDADMSTHIEDELRRWGVQLLLGTEVKALTGRANRVQAVRVGRQEEAADLALIDVGVRPNTDLAERAHIPLGLSGAVQVDGRGQSRQGSVWAAGNCAETVHQVSGRPIFSSLGTSAARQGRVVGENLAGLRSVFPGTLETSVEKVFNLAAARTGLTLHQALEHGFEADSIKISHGSRAGYYPGGETMHLKLIFEQRSGRLLGGQIIGDDSVAKRIDTLATALTAKMTLQQMAHLDLAYAPPYATLWDPIQIAANVAMRKLRR